MTTYRKRVLASLITSAALLTASPAAATPSAHAGKPTDVRVLAWNIYHGGLDDNWDDVDNRQDVIHQIVEADPDVFFSVETYGAGDEIVAGLEAATGEDWTGVQITPSSTGNDNLWLFTHYDIDKVFPAPTGYKETGAFHIGGARVIADDGRAINAFTMWSNYTNPWVGDLIEANALDVAAGREPQVPAKKIVDADRRQTQYVSDFLDYVDIHAPADEPVLMGGDLNTMPASDWTSQWARCADHFGLSYDLAATDQFTDAGFVDTYRAANPNVCRAPGMTWSPRLGMTTADRIDFIYAKGQVVQVKNSYTIADRLPGDLGDQFYSDHSAVVSDVRIK
ncbi:exotoxin [Streptomyces sp. NWU339]|uniref:endonuclease/exonuclease/phosphatase family protein n=1 Tax=Streptomyces sp. NWU339 TaxID=2185284 RepID=UPI000D673C2F|nr:endonuclease/exonuclease/phosphatase family protein [Streptomyces sp. NWU339]PWI06964.1 exotoxin [Streptomyces sp. NWU339]